MSYQTINNTEIETGKPVDQALFTKVKNNFDDHELRIAVLDGNVAGSTIASLVLTDPTHIHQHATGSNVQQQLDSADAALVTIIGDVSDLDNAISAGLAADRARLDALETDVVALETASATQTTQIADLNTFVTNQTTLNTTQGNTLLTHESNISQLISDVNSLETNVGTNTSSISSLNTRLTSVEGTISSHTSSISTINDKDAAQDLTLANHETRLGTAESNITTNSNSISTQAGQITSLQSVVSQHTIDIGTLQSDVATLQAGGGSGTGVASPDILHVSTAESEVLTDFATNTGLAIIANIPLHNSKSFRLIHNGSTQQIARRVIDVDRKFRGKAMNFSLDVLATTTSGNATVTFKDETSNTVIGSSQSITTDSQAITATTANGSNQLTGLSISTFGLLKRGMLITGTSIPSDTVITDLNSSTLTATMSQNATGVATGIRISALPVKREFTVTIPEGCASFSYTVTALVESNNAAFYWDDAKLELQQYSKSSTFASVTVPVKITQQIKLTGGSSTGATVTNWAVASNDNNGIMSAPVSGVITMQKAATVDITVAGNGGAVNNGPAIAIDGVQVIAQTNSSAGQGEHVSISLTLNPGQTISFLGNASGLIAWIVATADSTTTVNSSTIPLMSSVLTTEPDAIFQMNNFTYTWGTVGTYVFTFGTPLYTKTEGTAIKYVKDSVNGDYWEAQNDGHYTFSFGFDSNSASTTPTGLTISKNATQFNVAGISLPESDKLFSNYTADVPTINWAGNLKAGDKIRLHNISTTAASGSSLYNTISISYVGKTKILNPSIDQKIDIPTHELRLGDVSARGTGSETFTLQFSSVQSIKGDGLTVTNTNGTIINVKKKGKLTINASVYLAGGADLYISKNQQVNTAAPVGLEIQACQGTSGARTQIHANIDVVPGDIIRLSATITPTTLASNFASFTLQEQSVGVALQNVTPNWETSDSCLMMNSGVLSGAQNALDFLNTTMNIGSAIYYDSTTRRFYTREAGIFNITVTDESASSTQNNLIVYANIAGTDYVVSEDDNATSQYRSSASGSPYLNKGDYFRISSSNSRGTGGNRVITISKVGKTQGTVDVTPFVQIPQTINDSLYFKAAANTLLDTSGEFRFSSGSIATTNNGVLRIEDDATNTRTKFVAVSKCTINVNFSYSVGTAGWSSSIYKNGSAIAYGTTVPTAGYQSGVAYSTQLEAGEYITVAQIGGGVTAGDLVTLSITATATSSSVATSTQQVSSDTMNFVFKSTAINDSDPVGTFNTFLYTANTNTAVIQTATPTQSIASMNIDGVRLYARGYNQNGVLGQPNRFDIKIGKGLKSKQVDAYATALKTLPFAYDRVQSNTTTEFGATVKYSELTGILTIDAGICTNSSTTNRYIDANDVVTTNGYFVFNASQAPSLVSIPNLMPRIAYLSDVKPNGTAGGTFTSGSFQTRTLNTIVDPTGIIVSLNANQFTLAAGQYLIEASAPVYEINFAALRIRNISDVTTALKGQVSSAPVGAGTTSFVEGFVTIPSTKTFELQHYCTLTKTSDGFGVAVNDGEEEVYAQIKITKIK